MKIKLVSLFLLSFLIFSGCENPTNDESKDETPQDESSETDDTVDKPIFFSASSEDGLSRIATNGTEMESIIPWAYHSDVSPDKTKVVYHTSDGYLDESTEEWIVTDSEIWIADIDGLNKIKITDNDNISDFDPCFSPDGSTILFITDRNGNLDLYTVDLNGNNETQITSSSADECFAEYSPDGTKITYTYQSGNYSSIIAADVDGQNAIDLLQSLNHTLWCWGGHWSPDGTKVMFTIWNYYGLDKHILCTVNIDGTEPIIVYEDIDSKDGSYSPDGTKYVFESKVDGFWQIFTVNTDGTNLKQLTDLPNNCYHANWIP